MFISSCIISFSCCNKEEINWVKDEFLDWIDFEQEECGNMFYYLFVDDESCYFVHSSFLSIKEELEQVYLCNKILLKGPDFSTVPISARMQRY